MAYRCSLIFIVISLVFFSLFLSLYKGSTSIPFDQLLFSTNKEFHTIFFRRTSTQNTLRLCMRGIVGASGCLYASFIT